MKPTEQANKLMNGCGYCPRYSLCSECEAKKVELKIVFENELEKWEEMWNRNLLDKPKKEYNEGQMEFIKKQIEELKQAIKILENRK